MNRIMYDSVYLNQIPPSGSQMIAYYLNGSYASPLARVQAMFPGQVWVPIDVTGGMPSRARIFDVETGDITPADAGECISGFNTANPAYKHGGRSVIYCDRDNIPAVREGAGKFLLGRDYYLGVATLDGSQFTTADLIKMDTGPFIGNMPVVFCQVATIDSHPYHYDKSVVYSPQWMP